MTEDNIVYEEDDEVEEEYEEGEEPYLGSVFEEFEKRNKEDK